MKKQHTWRKIFSKKNMEETNEIPQGSDPDKTFPAIDVNKELNPGRNTNFAVDPMSSQVAATKEIQVHFLVI